MALLETTARRGGGAARGGSFGRNLSFITLTFQNSALILVMHYSRMMPPSGDHRYFTSTAVFLSEVIKLAVALTLAIYETSKTLAPSTPATTLFEQIYNAVFAGDGWKLVLPAVFYTLQNLLQYTALGELDPVHFQVLYQVKILMTAIFSVLLLRRQLGPKRWVSLIVLTLGVSVVSLPSSATAVDSLLLHGIPDHYFPRSQHELGQAASADLSTPDPHLTRRSATYEGIANDLPPPDPLMNYSVGVTAAVIAAIVSGLAGVYFEKLLKESPSQASVWVRNIQLSFYSLIAAFFGGVLWQDGSGIREHGFFEGYNWIVWAAIVLQAAGGLISSLVIRDADNIVKNFATSISIVISFVVSMWMFEFTVTTTFIIGTSLVLLATYLYSVPERGLRRPPPVRIANFEKPTIVPLLTPGTTPRTTDLARLNSDPFDGRGLVTTSSRPSSPMLPRQTSRTHVVPRGD
ncbi:UDP-N-acetylglucosamine transporter [Tolypocladium capitatum]|uniref:UDP-N-acetylglucosamine transporter n=1 Tax=Tolypocladium capitatum TaxID=45235 RepID=A0A2K3PXG6_9HYPO|nr:UDP-N-acetylglucosamine transporter [Tolypocladium capitatum]